MEFFLNDCKIDNESSLNECKELLNACKKGEIEKVAKLLEFKRSLVNIGFKYGDTPLVCAVKSDSEALVKMLLDKGANVNY